MNKLFIKSITELQNCGILRNWNNQTVFGKYTLIYGWNGSGKTTLTRIFRSLEKEKIDEALMQENNNPIIEIELLNNKKISSKNFSGWKNNIRIFNTDFVRDSINLDDASAEPVYHLGEEKGDILKEYNRIKDARKHKEWKMKLLNEEYKKINKEMEENLTDCARKISIDTYDRNFDKGKLKPNFKNFLKNDITLDNCIMDDIISEKQLAVGANTKEYIVPISLVIEKEIENIHVSVEKICTTSIIKISLEKLDDDTEIREWVYEGYKSHKVGEKCAFCDSEIKKERFEKLEKYFNTTYEDLKDGIVTEKNNLKAFIEKIENIKISDGNEFYLEIKKDYEKEKDGLINEKNELIKLCDDLFEALKNKNNKISESISLFPITELQVKKEKFEQKISMLNAVINKHNEIFNDFSNAKDGAINKIINHHSASHYPSYKNSHSKIENIKAVIERSKNFIEQLEARENQLGSELREHDVATDRINELLALLLGREDIEMRSNETGYSIMRGTQTANFLSEGERTSIAFAYFIAKIEEDDFNLEDSVIVIDDPISSLDSNALYSVSSFIRCNIEKANQIFILTHNYYFFSEIFGWIQRIKIDEEKIKSDNISSKKYIMLDCKTDKEGNRISIPSKMDTALTMYNSEYLFLFKLLYTKHKKNIEVNDENIIEEAYNLTLMANIARRILETFISFKFPKTANADGSTIINLSSVVKKIGVEISPEKINILDRCLNHKSHGTDAEMISHSFNLPEIPKVMRYVLEFIEKVDGVHYNELKKAIGIK